MCQQKRFRSTVIIVSNNGLYAVEIIPVADLEGEVPSRLRLHLGRRTDAVTHGHVS